MSDPPLDLQVGGSSGSASSAHAAVSTTGSSGTAAAERRWRRAKKSSVPGVAWSEGKSRWFVTVDVPGRTTPLICTFRPAARIHSPEQIERARKRAEAWRYEKDLYGFVVEGELAVVPEQVQTMKEEDEEEAEDEEEVDNKADIVHGASSAGVKIEPGAEGGRPGKRRRLLHKVKPEPTDDSASSSMRSLHTYEREKPNGRSPSEEEGFKFSYKFGGTLGGSEIFGGRGQHVEDEGMAVEPILADFSKCRVIKRASRSSGVTGLLWTEAEGAWKLRYKSNQVATKSGKVQQRFPAKRYMTDGQSYEEAVEAALQAAIARRQELVEEGVLEDKGEPKKEAIYQSGVTGVGWNSKTRCWEVVLKVNAKKHYKTFKPKDQTPAEIERARLLAEAARRDLEHEAWPDGTVVVKTRARTLEELVKIQTKDTGIYWYADQGRFLVQVQVRGKRMSSSVRPQYVTPDGVENARLRAIRVRDALQHVRRQAADDAQLDVTDLIKRAVAMP
eukprot:CAMPEP_0203854876 /NCGR_PEP_ID=MMETSP0359-20131031/9330_1 /ASSEMBLY_ACC=CAM_ASM_000338 /TAXON_ID=268821 /ORGANISM="Scrippsiella Hangoei, Strain SHTV-5" /LENGTH=501 /DNA_ID=CAMNT_0050771383 /DNA_START=100 /DNA_END=1605 /DNA_ORIENTATION=-